ncbi:hypothetical protein KSP39_PZI002987 [Platanthera zijinensis]|uniref:Uncharacterized protein n=1 Tax=Platanthera zijinensis TaxID=2320716 RepID=A0AAP0GC83_9ASPA
MVKHVEKESRTWTGVFFLNQANDGRLSFSRSCSPDPPKKKIDFSSSICKKRRNDMDAGKSSSYADQTLAVTADPCSDGRISPGGACSSTGGRKIQRWQRNRDGKRIQQLPEKKKNPSRSKRRRTLCRRASSSPSEHRREEKKKKTGIISPAPIERTVSRQQPGKTSSSPSSRTVQRGDFFSLIVTSGDGERREKPFPCPDLSGEVLKKREKHGSEKTRQRREIFLLPDCNGQRRGRRRRANCSRFCSGAPSRSAISGAPEETVTDVSDRGLNF